MRWIWFAVAALPLSGCALPPAITIASLILDTTSYAISGKTVTDHGLSAVMDQDCSIIGILDGQICQDNVAFDTTTATLQPLSEPGPDLGSEPQPETAIQSGDNRNEIEEFAEQRAAIPVEALGFAAYLSDGVQPSQGADG